MLIGIISQAALEMGTRRFQAIAPTSIMTFVGLSPMIFDRSILAPFHELVIVNDNF